MFMLQGAMNYSQQAGALYAATLKSTPGSVLLTSPAVMQMEWFRRSVLDKGTMAMFVLPLLMQLFSRNDPAKEPDRKAKEEGGGAADAAAAEEPQGSTATMNGMGLMQWLIVLQFSVLLATYSADFYTVLSTSQLGFPDATKIDVTSMFNLILPAFAKLNM
jgi:hypothetical protein